MKNHHHSHQPLILRNRLRKHCRFMGYRFNVLHNQTYISIPLWCLKKEVRKEENNIQVCFRIDYYRKLNRYRAIGLNKPYDMRYDFTREMYLLSQFQSYLYTHFNLSTDTSSDFVHMMQQENS